MNSKMLNLMHDELEEEEILQAQLEQEDEAEWYEDEQRKLVKECQQIQYAEDWNRRPYDDDDWYPEDEQAAYEDTYDNWDQDY